jgi:tetratricopeptide (TPR) repeat protein
LRLNPTPTAQARLKEAVALQERLDTTAHAAEGQITARRYPEAIRTLEEGLQWHPRAAKFHEKLGTLYAAVGKPAEAAERLRAVAKYDPDNANGYHLLGQWAFREGKWQEAAEHFRRADEVNPFTAEANYRWGLALLALERWPEAAGRFRQAVVVNPNHAGACQGLSHALRMQGQYEEAVRHAHHAARLTGFRNPDVLLTLVDALAGAGRAAEATDLAERARDEARTVNPELVPQITARLRELRGPSP